MVAVVVAAVVAVVVVVVVVAVAARHLPLPFDLDLVHELDVARLLQPHEALARDLERDRLQRRLA